MNPIGRVRGPFTRTRGLGIMCPANRSFFHHLTPLDRHTACSLKGKIDDSEITIHAMLEPTEGNRTIVVTSLIDAMESINAM